MKFIAGPERDKIIKNREKSTSKKIIILASVFAVISFAILILFTIDIPQLINQRSRAQYLYENGVEVDAHINSYYESRSSFNYSRGNYILKFEYNDENGQTYCDECSDSVHCQNKDEWLLREQEIKQLIAEGYTKKMLIADNGGCILAYKKEALLSYKNVAITVTVMSVSTVVLVITVFIIIKQAKKIKKQKV